MTVIAHTLLPDNIPPVSLIPTSPAFNTSPLLSVSAPPHALVVVVFASVIPPGKASVKVTPLNASVLGFANLIVSVDVLAGAIAFGLNDF